ncbi:MAG TPA: DNA translocase FtsK 4TM domain-containing protein, partial [Planctomycetota bacterium]|nr:DNA translocase FtsK 4TM domain-containing protein [Planctomycetota bacterium]
MSGMRRATAWALWVVALLCAAAFYTYDPSSNPGHLSNVVGPVGLFLSDTLVRGFGIGAFALSFYLLLMGYLVATDRPIRNQAIRIVGLVVCMLVLGSLLQTILASRAFPGGSVPLGGVIGESLSSKMITVIGKPLALVTLVLGGMGGFLLASDDLLSGALRKKPGRARKAKAKPSWIASLFSKPATASVPRTAKAKAASAESSQIDETEDDVSPARAKAPAKKATSKKAVADAEEDDLEEEEDEEEWEDEDEEDDFEEEDEDAEDEEDWEDDEEEEEEEEDLDEGEEDDEELEEDDAEEPRTVAAAKVRIRQGAKPLDAEGIQVIRLTREKQLADKYELPALALLAEPVYLTERESDAALQQKASALMDGLTDFGVNATVDEIERGPVITRFDLNLSRGTKISKVTGLADDLAMAMGVRRVRIAPVKGKSALGVEIPNKFRETVFLRELAIAQDVSKTKIAIPLFLGKDASGNPIVEDLASTPHLLIAGRTGAGKSVFVNSLILSILMTRYPEEVRLIMIDPKKVELEVYQDIPHLLTKVESNPKKATKILEWAVNQMEERYEILAATGVRHLTSYNRLSKSARREKLLKVYSEGEADRIPEHL